MITYSIEQLVHFKCHYCMGWWTIGDYDFNKLELTCPHCGKLHKVYSIGLGKNTQEPIAT